MSSTLLVWTTGLVQELTLNQVSYKFHSAPKNESTYQLCTGKPAPRRVERRFPWCKFSLHDQCQATSGLTTGLQISQIFNNRLVSHNSHARTPHGTPLVIILGQAAAISVILRMFATLSKHKQFLDAVKNRKFLKCIKLKVWICQD